MLHANLRDSASFHPITAGAITARAPRPAPPPSRPSALIGLADRARARGLTELASMLDHTAELLDEAPAITAVTRQPHAALHRLTYVSRAKGDWGDAGMGHSGAILRAARARNAAEGITGALAHSHDWFGQVLEGRMADIERTFGRIARDGRHNTIRVLDLAEIDQRAFGSWAMAEAGMAPEALLHHAATLHEHLHGATSTALRQAARDLVAVLCHRVAAA